ncbi:MAG: hypothetical protein J2P36_37435 [Ktedonobacteraceae bacterium]|nr:hypothetical protein [Ktedonobacteraceae bacterium]
MSYNPSNGPLPYGVPSLPPGYKQPLQQKKSHVGSWIIGIVVLLLLIGGGIYAYYAFQSRSTPEKTLNAFCDAWKTGNQQEMSDQLTSSAQKQVQVFQVILKAPPKECTVSNVQTDGSSATGTVTVTSDALGRPLSRPVAVNLDQEQGTWKITGFKTGQM